MRIWSSDDIPPPAGKTAVVTRMTIGRDQPDPRASRRRRRPSDPVCGDVGRGGRRGLLWSERVVGTGKTACASENGAAGTGQDNGIPAVDGVGKAQLRVILNLPCGSSADPRLSPRQHPSEPPACVDAAITDLHCKWRCRRVHMSAVEPIAVIGADYRPLVGVESAEHRWKRPAAALDPNAGETATSDLPSANHHF